MFAGQCTTGGGVFIERLCEFFNHIQLRHGASEQFHFGKCYQLPDSTSDEPNSHGFVKFSIRPKAGLPLGSTIANRAFIYFDNNTPVETNTVSNLFDFISQSIILNLLPLQIFPNPSNGFVEIQKQTDAWAELRVFNQVGALMHTTEIYSAKSPVDLSQLPAGVYWVVVKEKAGVSVGKIVMVQAAR